ncbi:centromere protein N-like [Styela clava]
MEDLLRYVMKKTSVTVLEHLILDWGKIPLKTLDFTLQKSIFMEKLISLCDEYRISYSDTAKLDLLHTMKFPEKYTWIAHKLVFRHRRTAASITDLKHFQNLISETLNKTTICDVAARKHKYSFWCRVSKPESHNAVYIIHYPESCYFLMAKTGTALIKSIVCTSLAECLNAESFTMLPLDGKCPDSLAEILLHRDENASHLYKYDQGYYLPRKMVKTSEKINKNVWTENKEHKKKNERANTEAFGPFVQPVMEHLTVDIHTKFRGRKVLPELAKDTVVHGRLEFSGTNVLQGLNNLAKESLAIVPMPFYLTSVPSLGKNYMKIYDK